MVEPEMAFYELTDNMDLAEAFLKRIVNDALDRCGEDMQFFHDRIDKEVFPRLEGILKGKYLDRKSTRLNSSHRSLSRMPSSA